MFSTGTPDALIVSSAASTSARFCGRTAARASSATKLCTPIEIRDVPRSASTDRRSGVAVAGEVSTDSGIRARSTPIVRSVRSNRRVSSRALRYVGVPPPNAAVAKPVSCNASRTCSACRSRASR
ncbi:hypothetical protein GCM10020220_112210 [Nonomuraea rubra]